MFGKEEKLYRVEIKEDVVYFNKNSGLAIRFTAPMGERKDGIIKKGIKGTVIKKWDKKYFSPDVDQEGIELFTPADQPYILVPYKVIENHYEITSE